MPICFGPTVIDCFELFIDGPTNITAHNQIHIIIIKFTSHGQIIKVNTGKYLIGITPQGTICFLSKGWGKSL